MNREYGRARARPEEPQVSDSSRDSEPLCTANL